MNETNPELPRIIASQAETLVKMAMYVAARFGDDKLLTKSVYKGLYNKSLVASVGTYKGMVPAWLTPRGGNMVGLILIAAQLAAQENA